MINSFLYSMRLARHMADCVEGSRSAWCHDNSFYAVAVMCSAAGGGYDNAETTDYIMI